MKFNFRLFAFLVSTFLCTVNIVMAEEVGDNFQLLSDVVPNFTLPSVKLIGQDGREVSFPKEIDDGKPVLLTFIYTSCKGVCPIISHVMKSVQNKLGERAKEIHMISISVDPEYDTPERLTQYSHQLEAGPQWLHFTGKNEEIVKLEKAFKVYRGDKMNHVTVFFVRPAPTQPWLRFIGFVNPDNLIKKLGL